MGKQNDILHELRQRVMDSTSTGEEKTEAYQLLKFYQNPNNFFNGTLHQNDYAIFPWLKLFLFNNNFSKLVEYCLNDQEFLKRSSDDTIENIRNIIGDGIDFRRGLYSRSIKEYGFDKSKIHQFDYKYATVVFNKFSHILRSIVQKEQLKEDKKRFLNVIESQKYVKDSNYEYFLEAYSVDKDTEGFQYDENYLRSVVLENKFIFIINDLLDDNALSVGMINGAIDVLKLGIRIKNHQLFYSESDIYSFFSEEEKNIFDVRKANETVKKLVSKRIELEMPGKVKLRLVK